jgi:AcrR family transcriptional regulator
MNNDVTKRVYRKQKRAQQEEETRRRITEAVMELHRTVGPANTKVTEVAELAGVSRMTVYNHFPAEADLIEACSTHWASQNPFPNPDVWAQESDPRHRLLGALTELYAWYRKTEDMMGKVLRDAPLVPALGELMGERWWPHVDRMVTALSRGLEHPEGSPEMLVAALRLAVDFQTWRLLSLSGLDTPEAAMLMAGMIACDRMPASST